MAYRRRSSRSARPTRSRSSRSSYSSRRASPRRSYRGRTSRGAARGQTIRIVLQQPTAAPQSIVNPQTGEMMAQRPARTRPQF